MAKLHVDVRKTLPGFTLEAGFDIDGQRLGLLGASGSGKSMTLCCIAGVLKPDEGCITLGKKVLFDSKAGVNLPPQARNVGYLFQSYALFPHLSAEQNIAFGLKARKKDKNEIERAVRESIRLLQLEGLERRYPSELSGGQQQRVALARILVCEPDILLLDEPFSALDSCLKWQLEQPLQKVIAAFTGPTVFVSHDRDEAYRLCTDIAVIASGRIDVIGEKKEVFARPQTYAAAQFTGCKNICRARKLSDNTVEAVDWGVVLHTCEPVRGDMAYVGIRAHHFRPAGKPGLNSVGIRAINVTEAPFSVSVTFENPCMPALHETSQLRWEIDREHWENVLQKKLPPYIEFPPDRLLLLR